MLQRNLALVGLLTFIPWFTPQLAVAEHSPPLPLVVEKPVLQPEPPILDDRGVVMIENNALVGNAVSAEIAYQNWEKEKQAVKPVVKKKLVTKPIVVTDKTVPAKSNTFAKGQCTDYVAHKINIPWKGNAGAWLKNSLKYGATVDKIPEVGAILVTNESRVGHVAYIESVSGNSFTFSEWNYAGRYKTTIRTFETGDPRIKGIIHFK